MSSALHLYFIKYHSRISEYNFVYMSMYYTNWFGLSGLFTLLKYKKNYLEEGI